MIKRYRYRIYPTDEQKDKLNQWFGCARYVWNHCLWLNKQLYKNPIQLEGEEHLKKFMNGHELTVLLPKLKQRFDWLKDPCATCLQQTTRDLGQTYQQAFKKGKGFPKFKKRGETQSIRYPQSTTIIFTGNRYDILQLPKLGNMKMRLSRKLDNFKSCTILKEPDGTYYASFVTVARSANPNRLPETALSIGVDLGVKDLAITSDGKVFKSLKDSNPNFKKTEDVLKTRQRKLANKSKGSNAWYKMKLLVANAYAKLRRQRLYHLHKVSKTLIAYGAIVFEDLNILKMTAKTKQSLKGMSKGILDGSWGMLQSFVEYKMKDWNKPVLYVDPYNTSKRCSKCHAINQSLTLGMREWTCGTCGTTHDRDINAAKNILASV